jgi:hypothetical protein
MPFSSTENKSLRNFMCNKNKRELKFKKARAFQEHAGIKRSY